MILIITGLAADPTVVRLSRVLQVQEVEHTIIAPTTVERAFALSIYGDDRSGHGVIRLNDRRIDLSQVRSALLWRTWARNPQEPGLNQLAEQREEWMFFRNEWIAFCNGFNLTLKYSGVFCVNPPPQNYAFEEKCCQLMLAAQSGLRIPTTLYTADLSLARKFYDEHADSIIYKPFKSYMHVVQKPEQSIHVQKLYTNRVKPEHLAETGHYIPTPSIFQPYIEKQFELRIVVIGRNLFACAIHSQQSERSREDWRRYDLDNTPHEPYDLPADIAQKILAFMDRLGLIFGSIDMIVTPDGEYIFLELNPTGQFDWIAHRAGLPLYQHLAAMLCAGRVDYPSPVL